jgi:hypothetical protein
MLTKNQMQEIDKLFEKNGPTDMKNMGRSLENLEKFEHTLTSILPGFNKLEGGLRDNLIAWICENSFSAFYKAYLDHAGQWPLTTTLHALGLGYYLTTAPRGGTHTVIDQCMFKAPIVANYTEGVIQQCENEAKVCRNILRNLMPGMVGMIDNDVGGIVQYAIDHGTRIVHETVLEYGSGEGVDEIHKAMEYLKIKPIATEWDHVEYAKRMSFGGEYLRRQVLAYLVNKAFKKETTTYLELATEFGLPTTGNQLGSALAPVLRDLVTWCQNRSLPPISALVVRKSGGDEGLPGSGFWPMVDEIGITKARKRELTAKYHKEIFAYYDMSNVMGD